MRDAAIAEEGGFTPEGAIDELVDEDEEAGIEFRLERAAGGDGDEIGDAGLFQRIDIGAVIDAGRREPVAASVAGQEHHLGRADLAEAQRVRRLAPRRRDVLFAQICEARQVIDARAADDPDDGFESCRPDLDFADHDGFGSVDPKP